MDKKKLVLYGANGMDIFSQLMSMGQGISGVNTGIFNFDFTNRKNPETAYKYIGHVNDFTNGLANTGVLAAGQYMLNKSEDPTTNKINGADAISQTVLGGIAATPGLIGNIGKGLNLINNVGGQLLSKKFEKDLGTKSKILDQTSAVSGLTNLQNNVQSDKSVGNTLIGHMFGTKKKKNAINAQKQLRQKGTELSNMLNFNQKRRTDSLSSMDSLTQQNALSTGGYYDDIQFGKQGTKFIQSKPVKGVVTPYKSPNVQSQKVENLSNKQETSIIKKLNKIYDEQDSLNKKIKDLEMMVAKKIEMKKDGGPINIIVDGQLHAHKHQLKTMQEFKDAQITHKGVPVILEDGGEINQVQEVEADELILHLDLTKKMEELAKIGSEEAMIEAGKLLAKELVKNTKDNKNKILKNG